MRTPYSWRSTRHRSVPIALAALIAALLLVAAACSGDDRDGQGSGASGTTSGPAGGPGTSAGDGSNGSGSGGSGGSGLPATGDLAKARVRLQQVGKLESPVGMAVRKGDSGVYFIEQTGRVRAFSSGSMNPGPILDISGQIKAGGEQGLLGIAFSPDGKFLYLDYTDTNGDTHVAEFAMRGDRPDPSSQRNVLTVQQPYANHNGGQLAFGPDGLLYIALGDGGSAGDPHQNGQSLGTLLGKILRIDPRPSGGRPYGIPKDNPFAGRAGARPEIWDFGLRNPWRFSFDPATKDLWIADVGQGNWEEIDHEPAGRGGRNYGWNRLEGTHHFEGTAPAGAVDPVLEYNHDGGACTVIGGSVYRGGAIPNLRGAYLYGDYCLGWVKAVQPGHFGDPQDLGINVPSLTSFGVDQHGELFALSGTGPIYKIVKG
jgi:glucose/arabinose dehydrogenase